jgi:hypothetical protein
MHAHTTPHALLPCLHPRPLGVHRCIPPSCMHPPAALHWCTHPMPCHLFSPRALNATAGRAVTPTPLLCSLLPGRPSRRWRPHQLRTAHAQAQLRRPHHPPAGFCKGSQRPSQPERRRARPRCFCCAFARECGTARSPAHPLFCCCVPQRAGPMGLSAPKPESLASEIWANQGPPAHCCSPTAGLPTPFTPRTRPRPRRRTMAAACETRPHSLLSGPRSRLGAARPKLLSAPGAGHHPAYERPPCACCGPTQPQTGVLPPLRPPCSVPGLRLRSPHYPA